MRDINGDRGFPPLFSPSHLFPHMEHRYIKMRNLVMSTWSFNVRRFLLEDSLTILGVLKYLVTPF